MDQSTQTSLRARSRHRRAFIWASIAIVLTLGGGGAWFSVEKSGQEAQAGSIQEVFDINNASFYLLESGVPAKKVHLKDGTYYPDGAGGDDPHMRVVGDPLNADLDGDGDTDVAAVLEWTGETDVVYSGWRAVYFWLWEDGRVRTLRWPASWQWNCVVTDQPDSDHGRRPNAISIMAASSPYGAAIYRHVDNRCGDDVTAWGDYGASVAVTVEHEVPVLTRHLGDTLAVESCPGGAPNQPRSGIDYIDITDQVSPVLVPVDDAPPIRGPDPEIADPSGEKDLSVMVEMDAATAPSSGYLKRHNGYVNVVVGWEGMARGCGWVPWDEVSGLLK